MSNYTKDEILRLVEEEDITFIRLQFTDMFGVLRNIAIPSTEIMRALDNDFVVDGSFIAGIATQEEPNMFLHPVLDSFTVLPWRPRTGKVARLLCDVYNPDGSPHVMSSRYLLEKVCSEAAGEGYSCQADAECEFFLFHTDENGIPTTLTHERAGYLDLEPVDLGGNARRDMVLTIEQMGYQVSNSHHERCPAQHEIDLKGADLLHMADCVMSVKMAVKSVAKSHGLHATFMPKPKADVNGSGLHVNFTLFKDGKNVFEKEGNPSELSDEAYFFIGGLLAHSQEIALITNPLVNSYKRLVPGYDAPTELTWTRNNLNSLIRIPVRTEGQTRIELRSPDAASNPYLVFAVCLAAGLDGIRRQIYPTKASGKILNGSDRRAMNIKHLPRTLGEALQIFTKSSWVVEVLGKEFCEEYAQAKKKEWGTYIHQVSSWEIEQYLYRF